MRATVGPPSRTYFTGQGRVVSGPSRGRIVEETAGVLGEEGRGWERILMVVVVREIEGEKECDLKDSAQII